MSKPFIFIDDLSSFNTNSEINFPILKIYNIECFDENVPAGFNAVRILLDGRTNSDLNWKATRYAAVRYMAQGMRLFWEIDLGLFGQLQSSLSDQAQYLSLRLALEHFRDTLWKEFSQHTIGLCLYRGSIDFSHQLLWDATQVTNLQEWLRDLFKDVKTFVAETGIEKRTFEEIDQLILTTTEAGESLLKLFCRDAAMEYINLLAGLLPDGVIPFVLLDTSSIKSSLLLAQLLSKERFERVLRVTNESLLPINVFSPSGVTSGFVDRKPQVIKTQHPTTLGVCLPPTSLYRPSHDLNLQKAFNLISEKNIPFRIIFEDNLTTEWEGLDHLLVSSSCLTPQGIRKLRGFGAAGGTVLIIGESIGLPYELQFKDWIMQC
jgi:hypothetical protein